jgi:hypothetical protein
MDHADDWVQVRNCNWVHQAHQPLYGIAIGGVRVLVRARDLQRAAELLDAVDATPAEPLDEDAP